MPEGERRGADLERGGTAAPIVGRGVLRCRWGGGLILSERGREDAVGNTGGDRPRDGRTRKAWEEPVGDEDPRDDICATAFAAASVAKWHSADISASLFRSAAFCEESTSTRRCKSTEVS